MINSLNNSNINNTHSWKLINILLKVTVISVPKKNNVYILEAEFNDEWLRTKFWYETDYF